MQQHHIYVNLMYYRTHVKITFFQYYNKNWDTLYRIKEPVKYNFITQLTIIFAPILGVYSLYLQTKLNNLEVLMTTTKEAHATKVADLIAKINEHQEYSQKLRNIVDTKTQQMIDQTINYNNAVQQGNNAISQLNNGTNMWYWAIGIILFCGTVALLVFYLKQNTGIPDLVGNLANRTAEYVEKDIDICATKIIKSNTNNTEAIVNTMKELFNENNKYYTEILSSIKMDILELQERSGYGITEIINKSGIEIQKKASDAYMDHLTLAMSDAYKNAPEFVEIINKTVEEIAKSI